MATISFNGSSYDEEIVRQAAEVAPSLTRQALAMNRGPGISQRGGRNWGKQYDGDRDVWEVLGYDKDLDAEKYRDKYERQDLATKIVKLPAEDTWRYPPKITDDPDSEEETKFEREVQNLVNETNLYHYLRRADIVTGIGEYGILFLGLNDGGNLEDPVNESQLNEPSDVSFMTPFAQDSVSNWRLGREEGLDVTDERYNKPVRYELDFSDIDDHDTSDERWVHHSRVIHIVDGADDSDLKGTPRLQCVYNRLDDLEKTVGASAEMFWSGADRKLHFNINTEESADIPDEELENLNEEVQKLVHDMQQHIKTFNTDLNVIGGEEVDPTGIIDEILKFIAGATGIPQRMLTGSERGELASSQDRATWYGRVQNRQNRYADPIILRPIIDKFIEWGIVSEASDGWYDIEWRNLFELTDVEVSEIQKNRATAVSSIAPQGNTDILVQNPEDLWNWVVHGEVPKFDEYPEQHPIALQPYANPEAPVVRDGDIVLEVDDRDEEGNSDSFDAERDEDELTDVEAAENWLEIVKNAENSKE